MLLVGPECQDRLDQKDHREQRARKDHLVLPDRLEWMAQRVLRGLLGLMVMKDDQVYLEIRDHGDHLA